MNEDGNMNTTADTANKASELRPDIDLNDPKLGLKIAAERLSIVRYVFLVQIEDGIASAAQRASLEYADAVLIGWPETDSPEVADLNDAQLKIVREHMELMEGYIGKYSQMEHDGDLDGMTDTLIRITERVAEVRRLYQPDFPLPTFAEIRRVVQDEWDEDMGKIDPKEDNPTAGEIEEETESADDVTDSHKTAASVQSEKTVESAEPAEIIAVTQGETERRMSDLSAPAGASSHGKGRLSARGNWHTRLRVGIMGGTFDPIHNGHLVAASEVAWVYDLDEVIFVPTGRPVFKLDKHVTNAEDRYLMTVIATASNPKFTVSRVDIDRPGVTYTIDTLRDIRAQHPDAELFFITGADAVAEIMQWKDADLMWDLAHFVAVTRPGYSSPDGVTLPEGKVDTLEIPALAISSTDVRRRAEHDEPVWYLVPDGVVQYIGKHGLYSYED